VTTRGLPLPSADAPAATGPPAVRAGAPSAAGVAASPADDGTRDAGFGAYLHVPFCASRCDYCAFATWTDRHHLMADYVAACLGEIEQARRGGELVRPSSVFVGGGTPSLLPPADLARLVEALDPAPGAEVTVECNPESTTASLLERLASAGVTRISLGAQSMREHVLAGLGRRHRPGTVAAAAHLVGAAGFCSYNVDLIYGGAGETDEDWLESLEGVLGLDPPPPHVSAYALTVEPGTPLWRDAARHPDDDVLATRYELADDVLSRAGLSWYEISNWARPGHECAHNRLYWRGGSYRGIGCAAHSHLAGRRFWNLRRPERYIAAVAAGRRPLAGSEQLEGAEREGELLALALRTREGVPSTAFADAQRDELLTEGLLRGSNGRLVLTRRGRLLANEVTLRLRSGAR
jgi:putative oxygen-independent coproporphyrinogen III oxidase